MKSLRKAVEDYIALRRSLGFKLRDMATGLADFVSFLEQKAAPHITTALALEWATQPRDHQPSDWARRLGFVRVFAPLERDRSPHRGSIGRIAPVSSATRSSLSIHGQGNSKAAGGR